ncbi:MAG: hypothetical protein GW760_06725 [Legionella sp.]|nr:hypothetical protein [Legionella sp.]
MVAILRSKGPRLLVIESGDKPSESHASKKHNFRRRASFWGLPQAYEELPGQIHTKPSLG